MGMAGNFLRIPADQLHNLKSNPNELDSLVEDLFSGGVDYERFCDVDKSWQSIHFLLAGEPWGGESTEAQAVLGGVEFGPDLGYGPARYHDPERVKQIWSSLSSISVEELTDRFDPLAMQRADIYAFDPEYAEDELEMAQDYYEELRRFYSEAAEEDNAVLLFIT